MTADKTAEAIEDILSGTMRPKQGLWVGYMHALNIASIECHNATPFVGIASIGIVSRYQLHER